MSAIPLAELKVHLNITRTTDDAEIQRVLNAAELWVNAHTGARLGGGTETLSARSLSGSVLVLPATRLSAVTKLTDPDGVVTVPAAKDVDLLAGIVALPYRAAGIWRVEVTFAAEIPADLRLATLIIAKHLWETQRVPGQPEGARPGFGVGGHSEVISTPLGFAIPHRAKELLARYWIPGTA